MFPVALNLTKIPVLLVGKGTLLQKRLEQLQAAKASRVTVVESDNVPQETIAKNAIVMVAGLDSAASTVIANAARAAGKLVNVEDINELCDFYFTANLRRGDLLIAVSTGGASPTLARRVRDKIALLFGEEWESRVNALSHMRKQWKAGGKSMQEVMQATDAFLAQKEWL